MQRALPWVENCYNAMVHQHGYEQGKTYFFMAMFYLAVYLGQEKFNEKVLIGYWEQKYLWS